MKTILLILGGLLAGYLVVNQLVVNTYDGQVQKSWNKEESKRLDLYAGEYKPGKSFVWLKDNRQYTLEEAWAETNWTISHYALFFSRINTRPGLTIYLPDMVGFRKREYAFQPLGEILVGGGLDGVGQSFFSYIEPDSITFLVKCKKGVSWEETIITDTVVYYKDI
jgi:hypothetical protein